MRRQAERATAQLPRRWLQYGEQQMPPRLLTEKQAAEYTGYRPATFRQSRWTGQLGGHPAPKSIKIGRAVRYEITELDAWIESIKLGANK